MGIRGSVIPSLFEQSGKLLSRWRRAAPATAREQRLAALLFLGSADRVGQLPKGATSLEVVRRVLSSDLFLERIGAEDEDPAAWSEARNWGRGLPLSEAGQSHLDKALTRQDALDALFTDPEFLEGVLAGQTLAFSPGELTRGAPADAEDRAFVQELLARGSALIDARYLARWGLETLEDSEALIRYGRQPWFTGTPLFDAAWYARQVGTIFDGWFSALRDYVEKGEAQGRSPNPFINPRVLVEANADLLAEVRSGASLCWLEHLVKRDAVDGLSSACHFDPAIYSEQVAPKSWQPFGSPLAHYVAVGWRAGLSPNPCFDPLWYLRTYSDALASVQAGQHPNAFSHFIQVGASAGLRPTPFFDASLYADCNADLKSAEGLDLFRHFWSQGRLESRDVGDCPSRAVVNAFRKRLPMQSDLIIAGRFAPLVCTPQAVMAAALEEPITSLVDVILSGQASQPRHRVAVVDALTQLSRPQARIEHGADQQVHAGDALCLYVSGEVSFGGLPLKAVRASHSLVGERGYFTHISLAQVDAAAVLGVGGEALRSGFMAWFEFSARGADPGVERVNLEFVFEGANGVELVANETVTIQILARPRRSATEAPVQVAMASYNPPKDPFRRQVDSILANAGTHLLISDDASPAKGVASLGQFAGHPQVDIDSSSVNTGFIINFERSLYMCSDAARTILFADQDDIWRSDKVDALVDALDDDGVVCAFSDMRITTGDGKVISPTFWNSRTVHHYDPLTIGIANTVTGAAAAFPADLKEFLAPFPRYTSGLYHDQWLAVLSAAAGRIAYINRPLYDYIQHGGNVLGFTGSRVTDTAKWPSILRRLKKIRRSGQARESDVELVAVALGQAVGVMQRFVMWREALSRVPAWEDPEVRRLAQEACAAVAGQPYRAAWLRRAFGRLARRAGGERGLLAIDSLIEAMLLARHLVDSGVVDAKRLARQRDEAQTAQRAFDRRVADRQRTDFDRKVEGVASCARADDAPVTINLFLPELNLRHFFGGYHSKISLITRLRERGIATRLILVDEPRVRAEAIAEIIGAFPELERGLSESSVEAIGLRDKPLALGTNDVLMATTWWSAHVVEGLRRQLGRERFLYFVQEYEPFTFSLGTWYRAAELTYDLPHDAIFSTEVLQNFFHDKKIGVFAPGNADSRSLAFRNPITGLRDIARVPLGSGRRPRLLFYARPQPTEARNMYDFGLAALRLAAAELGDELDGWELIGVGADRDTEFDLGLGRSLRLIKKLDGYGYREMLASSDVGLALMYTPHPSLVPLEMAAAGLVTVTNTCMSKTAASFADASPLIRVAEPEVRSIADELVAAVLQVKGGSVCNPGLDWPVNPREAFPDKWLEQFVELAERSIHRR